MSAFGVLSANRALSSSFRALTLRRMRSTFLVGGLTLCMVIASGCARIRPPNRAPDEDRTLLTTGYCECGICCGWKRTWYGRPVYAYGPNKGKRKAIGITASGTRAHKGTIAADTRRFPFGTIMYVEGYGYGRVEDRGGEIKGAHIDLFFPSHGQAKDWGKRRKRVKIWRPRD